jgi:hypothetical protein
MNPEFTVGAGYPYPAPLYVLGKRELETTDTSFNNSWFQKASYANKKKCTMMNTIKGEQYLLNNEPA